jgi:hypothetical protein
MNEDDGGSVPFVAVAQARTVGLEVQIRRVQPLI